MNLLANKRAAAVALLVPLLAVGFAALPILRRHDVGAAIDEAQAVVTDLRDRLATLPAPAPVVSTRPVSHSQIGAVPDLAGTMRDLESLAAVAQAGLTNAAPLAGAVVVPGRQEFRISGRARPTSLCTFLAAIENSARLMVIASGRVEAAAGDTLDYEFVLATFHHVEEAR